jgi:hypothetical protein
VSPSYRPEPLLVIVSLLGVVAVIGPDGADVVHLSEGRVVLDRRKILPANNSRVMRALTCQPCAAR